MELILYTIMGLILYGVSDYILNAIEIKMGKRLPNRSLVFFVIIGILAVSSFGVIRMLYKGPEPTQTTQNIPPQPATAPQTAPIPAAPSTPRPAEINKK